MDHDDPDMQSLVSKRGRKRKEPEKYIYLNEKDWKKRVENQRNDLEA